MTKPMIRKHFHLPKPMLRDLEKEAKGKGIKLAEYVRRILEDRNK